MKSDRATLRTEIFVYCANIKQTRSAQPWPRPILFQLTELLEFRGNDLVFHHHLCPSSSNNRVSKGLYNQVVVNDSRPSQGGPVRDPEPSFITLHCYMRPHLLLNRTPQWFLSASILF